MLEPLVSTKHKFVSGPVLGHLKQLKGFISGGVLKIGVTQDIKLIILPIYKSILQFSNIKYVHIAVPLSLLLIKGT